MIKMNDDVIMMDMRTIVEIPGEQIDKLSEVCRQDKISRAEAIRRAIDLFLCNRGTPPRGKEVFGMWRDREMDGLEYQVKLRSEW